WVAWCLLVGCQVFERLPEPNGSLHTRANAQGHETDWKTTFTIPSKLSRHSERTGRTHVLRSAKSPGARIAVWVLPLIVGLLALLSPVLPLMAQSSTSTFSFPDSGGISL